MLRPGSAGAIAFVAVTADIIETLMQKTSSSPVLLVYYEGPELIR
jgi:hypothetical protein